MDEQTNHIRDELRDIAPELSEMGKDHGFEVPHNYFRTLPDEVLERVQTEAHAPSAWALLGNQLRALFAPQRRPQFAFALAGIATLVVMVVFVFPKSGTDQSMALNDITTEEAYAYALANIDDIDQEELYAMSEATELDMGGLNNVTNEELNEALDDLLDEIDPETIEALF